MVLGNKCGESRGSRDMKRDMKLSCIPYGFHAQILWVPLSALHCVFFSGGFSGPIVDVLNCWFSDKQGGSGGKTRVSVLVDEEATQSCFLCEVQ